MQLLQRMILHLVPWMGCVKRYRPSLLQTGAGVRINLLFSQEAEGVRLTSHLSRSGRLEIENGSGRPVLVRIPSWVDKKEVCLKVNGVESQKIFIQSYLLITGNEIPLIQYYYFPNARSTDGGEYML